jgi:hypothetical protein
LTIGSNGSERSANRFVSVFEMFKSPKLGDLGGLTIDASSLYLIAAPSTPEEVRQAVLDKAARRRKGVAWIACVD